MSSRAIWWAVTIDCNEPRRVATFWAELLDSTATSPGEDRAGWFRVQPHAPGGPFLNFQPVAERKTGKVRIHLDVLVDDLGQGVARVAALGGSDSGTRETLPRARIALMRDPEGNEFCPLAPPVK